MELHYVEEPTFRNDGQFTSHEMDLMDEALNDLLQTTNKKMERHIKSEPLEWQDKLDDIEELIVKLKEGS